MGEVRGGEGMIHVVTDVDDQRVQDLLCCALEGGSNYWYVITAYNYPEGHTRGDFEFPHLELPFRGGSLSIADREDGEHLGVLDREACERGLQVMAEKYPQHYADFISENEDADTGDVFLQCALLGEIVYG